MSHTYNSIRLSLSAVNRMTIKNLIRNRTIRKCFSLYEKRNFDFTTMFCGTTLSFNALIIKFWSIIWIESKNLYFYKKQSFVRFYRAKYFAIEIQKQGTDFQYIFIVIVYYHWFYFKCTIMQIKLIFVSHKKYTEGFIS